MAQGLTGNPLGFGRGLGVRVVTVGAFTLLYVPILILILNSFNASRFASHWGGFSLKWYGVMWQDAALWSAIRNTLIIAVANMLISTVLGTMAALALGRFRFKLARVYESVLQMPIIIPDIVQAISLLLLFAFFHFTLGVFSVILAHASFSISFVALIVLSRLSSFDRQLEEVAQDLGATRIQVLTKVVLPVIFPGILAGALMAFTLSVDDFVITFFTAGVGGTTLPLKIYSMIKFGITPEINAISTVLILFSALVIIGVRRLEPIHE